MTAPDATGRVELDGPYDLHATMARYAVWGRDPTMRFRDGEVWNAFRTSSGPASVRYVQRESVVEVEAWGPGAKEAVASAPDHVGAGDRSWRVEIDHPVAGPLLQGIRGLRFGRAPRVVEPLVATIIAQKVTSEGASQSFRELVWRYGERAPGPAKLWVPPTAERLRELPYYELHTVGIERRRAETIRFAVRRAKRLEGLASVEPGEAYERLLAFPGIGPWTAGHVISKVHGDADAVPIGDFHFPNYVAFALAGEARADDARMLALLEPFRPYRGRLLIAILRGAPPPPKFGPRLSVRDIREQ